MEQFTEFLSITWYSWLPLYTFVAYLFYKNVWSKSVGKTGYMILGCVLVLPAIMVITATQPFIKLVCSKVDNVMSKVYFGKEG